MKKLMIYVAVIIGCLFIGLTTYYLLKDYDIFTISQNGLAVDAENDIYLNKGQTSTLEINIDKKSEDTEVTYSFDNEGIASFDLETGKITALKGGTTKLKVFTNKDALGFFEFNISVGDGTSDNAWFIFNVADLKAIGATRSFEGSEDTYEWSLSDCYQLMNDIDLGNSSWQPIGIYDEIVNKTIDDTVVKVLQGKSADYFSFDFTGEFNGNGHKIKNLKIEGTHITAGLFASIADSAIVCNVIFENVDISGYFIYAGTVAGVSLGSSIEKVEVINANIKLTAPEANSPYDVNFVGGIIGYGLTKEPGEYVIDTNTLSLCSFSGKIEIDEDAALATTYAVGGICGSGCGVELLNNKSTLELKIKSYLEKSNTTQNNSFGGIIGTSYCDNINFDKGLTAANQNIYFPIIMNNLAVITYDAVNGKMAGIVGQRALKSTTDEDIAAYLTAHEDKMAEVESLIDEISGAISSRITGNIYANNSESVAELTIAGENENKTVYYSGIFKQAVSDLSSIETFKNKNWSISNSNAGESTAWIIDGNNIAEININGVSEETVKSQKYIELNKSNFEEYVNKMLISGDHATSRYWLSREYKLTEDIDLSTIDAFKDAWSSIYGTKTNLSFTGVFDGDGHTISNLKIVNLDAENKAKLESVGLFSTISSTAVVKNLKLVNVDIDYADYAGAIAGINLGTIRNCSVESVHIANAKTAGFLVGHNKGIIETTNKDEEDNLVYTVFVDAEDTNKINSDITSKSVFLGGIAGYNIGKIEGAKIEANFKITGAKAYNSAIVKMLGGIAGYNGGIISNCSVENASIVDNSTVYTYLGGIAGLTNGIIENCYAGVPTVDGYSISIEGNVEENNIIIGGIAGQISEKATVSKCFVKADLNGYYIGGVAANLFGNVSECYILGSFKGDRVGGISVNVAISNSQQNAGDVKDCYVGATLNGYTKDAKVAGLSVYIVRPGKFDKVIVSAVFSGLGNKYYESYTNTRGDMSWTNFGTKLGYVYNIVIDGSLNDKSVIKNRGSYQGQSAEYIDTATLKSGENYFIEKGYNVSDQGEWLMEPQKAPLLRNLNLTALNEVKDEAENSDAQDTNDAGDNQTQNTESETQN